MRQLKKLSRTDIVLNEPLRFSVFDQSGVLLLRKGFVVTVPAQIERLISGGIYQDLDEPARAASAAQATQAGEKAPVFLTGELVCSRVKSLYSNILRLPGQVDAQAKGLEVAAMIQEACADDADSLIAALHLDIASPYLLVHQSLGGALVELVAAQAGVAASDRRALIAAAVTRDIAQTVIQAEMDRVQGPLPDELRARMESHPTLGCELLKKSGVSHKGWLEAVASHHERMDGSGYTARMEGEAIPSGARMLAVCDVYSAMVKPRPYRTGGKAVYTQAALRNIYASSGNTLDQKFAALLVKAIGVLPAGSIVKLECGEIAVIKSACHNPADVTVHSIYDKNQMPLMNPLARQTSQAGFAIQGMVHYAECRSAQLTIRRLWLKGN